MALDLKRNEDLINRYIRYHKNVWPEIKESIRFSGILDMEIYLFSNRLFMIIEVDQGFSFEKKAHADMSNPKVQEWETLMMNFQQRIEGTKDGEKWCVMRKIFDLKE